MQIPEAPVISPGDITTYDAKHLGWKVVGGIGELTFLKPSLTIESYQELFAIIEACNESPEVLVIILFGSKKMFGYGGAEIIPVLLDKPEIAGPFATITCNPIRAMRDYTCTFPTFTIAAVNGQVMGAHSVIAVASDEMLIDRGKGLRETFFKFLFAAVGLTPDDMGIVKLLVELLGRHVVAKVLSHKMGRVTPYEAYRWGLIGERPARSVEDLHLTARAKAAHIVSEMPPEEFANFTRSLRMVTDLTFVDALQRSEDAQAGFMGKGRGSNFDIGFTALNDRSKPRQSPVFNPLGS